MRDNIEIQEELNSLSTIVGGIPFVNVYSVPGNYFTQLNAQCKQRISSIDNNQIPAIKHLTPFAVPDNYFDVLPHQIINKTSNINRRATILHFSSIGRKVAAGFVIFFIAGLISLYFFNKHADSSMPDNEQMAVFADAKKIIATNSFEEELAKVDAADLEEYLASNGHDINAALIASVENDDEITNEDELLTDDQAIDQLYNKMNLSNNNNN